MSAVRPVPVVSKIHASHVIFWKRTVLETQIPQKTAERAMGALCEGIFSLCFAKIEGGVVYLAGSVSAEDLKRASWRAPRN
jgi:hypothetical protein